MHCQPGLQIGRLERPRRHGHLAGLIVRRVNSRGDIEVNFVLSDLGRLLVLVQLQLGVNVKPQTGDGEIL